jgi:hypothetical protein
VLLSGRFGFLAPLRFLGLPGPFGSLAFALSAGFGLEALRLDPFLLALLLRR